MENQVARRRISLVAGHFSATGDISASHVMPAKCSGSMMTSVFQRYDGKVNFARQGSDSQAFFMKQASTEKGSSAQPTVPLKFSTANEGSLIASEAPKFSRPARMERYELPATDPPVYSRPARMERYELPANDPPKFSRPARMECYEVPATDPPKFPTPSPTCETKLHPKIKFQAPALNGGSPRMDVAESGRKYVVTVELPGVGINDIRVEVNDQSLTVLGKRSAPWWKVTNFLNDSIPTYHKREILEGEYHVVWPLPAGVNKDSVTAEFVDGILQITIPKL